MSKRRLSGPQSKASPLKRGSKAKTKSTSKTKSDTRTGTKVIAAKAADLKTKLKSHHFLGVALGGGKTDRTCVADLEYFPQQKKVFLARLYEGIRTEGETSADLYLHRVICEASVNVMSVSFDVPITLPKCMRCTLKCPGYEDCLEPEITWLWNEYRQLNKKHKPKKMFTPYTQRCAEVYMSKHLEENFYPPHALGANLAPLVARAHFIARRLQKYRILEVNPKVSLWRIGRALDIQKNYLRYHRHSTDGEMCRAAILEKLSQAKIAFFYNQDIRAMVGRAQAFDALLAAFTGYLEFRGMTEERPPHFPAGESWVTFPKVGLVLGGP